MSSGEALRSMLYASRRERLKRKPKTQAQKGIFHGPAAPSAARRSSRGRYPGRYDPGSLRQLLRREAGQAGCDQNPARHLDQSPDQGLAQALVAALAQALVPALAEAGIRLSLPGPAGRGLRAQARAPCPGRASDFDAGFAVILARPHNPASVSKSQACCFQAVGTSVPSRTNAATGEVALSYSAGVNMTISIGTTNFLMVSASASAVSSTRSKISFPSESEETTAMSMSLSSCACPLA